MNFNAENLVGEIRKREKDISWLQSSMWNLIGFNCFCHFIVLFAIALDAAEKDLSCKSWPFYLQHIIIVSAAFISFVFMTLIEYLGVCKKRDEDIEKLEVLKRAHPELVHIHAKEAVAPRLFCAVVLLLLVMFDALVYCGANAIFAGACDLSLDPQALEVDVSG